MAQQTDPAPPRTPDTGNHFMVAVQGRRLTILRPPIAGALLEAEQAANLAAWIVALISAADPAGRALFERTLDAVRGT